MDLNEDVLYQKKSSMSVGQRVKKYREQRRRNKSFKVENKKVEKLKKLTVNCISETLTNYQVSVRENNRRKRTLKRGRKHSEKPKLKPKYQSHYVKKTVKNTYKKLPRSPAEQAEVLSKLAEQALAKLQSSPHPPKKLLRVKIKKK